MKKMTLRGYRNVIMIILLCQINEKSSGCSFVEFGVVTKYCHFVEFSSLKKKKMFTFQFLEPIEFYRIAYIVSDVAKL